MVHEAGRTEAGLVGEVTVSEDITHTHCNRTPGEFVRGNYHRGNIISEKCLEIVQ